MEVSHPPTGYGHCDSFFVEGDDHSMAERIRERERALSKLNQQELAAELSSLTSDEYLEEVLDHMEHMESATMADVSSIDIQHEIQWYMRPYLLDFLVEAHAAFGLLPDTLYLTINLLDRYCSRRVVYKRHYQLVGCAALLIAAKYGDKKDRVPTFRELRSMCCQLYEEEMFMQMEWHVLQTLDYVLGHPTIDSFLQIALSEADRDDPTLEHMTWYICEISLYYKEFVSVRPSVLARSALALARCVLGRAQVPSDQWSGRYESLVVLNLVNYLSQPSQVLSRKYNSQKLSNVAHRVEHFLQTHQSQLDVTSSPGVLQVQQSHAASFATPQTPNKSAYAAAVMQHGCLTPPITPDGDPNASTMYGLSPQYPATPTPVPSDHVVDPHSAMAQQPYSTQQQNFVQLRSVQ